MVNLDKDIEGKIEEIIGKYQKREAKLLNYLIVDDEITFFLPLSDDENRAGMLQIAAIPTMPYTILDSRLPLPKINATRSKFKRPISPQLIAPIIPMVSAAQSMNFLPMIYLRFIRKLLISVVVWTENRRLYMTKIDKF